MSTAQTGTVHFVPEHGEIFEFQIYSFEPHDRGGGEAIPGGAFEPVARINYEEDPQGFTSAMLGCCGSTRRGYTGGLTGAV